MQFRGKRVRWFWPLIWISRLARRKRMQRFADLFHPDESTVICDVGGTWRIWRFLAAKPRVIIINRDEPETGPENFEGIRCDATAMPFADSSVDIAFSNSVIEHLGNRDNQHRFADEIRRIGTGVFVQTPAKEFPVEMHTTTPFIHWLPLSWQRKLVRFSVRGLIKRWKQKEADEFLDQLCLLTRRDIQELFPNCQIITERVLGIPKSHIAVKLPK